MVINGPRAKFPDDKHSSFHCRTEELSEVAPRSERTGARRGVEATVQKTASSGIPFLRQISLGASDFEL